MKRILPAAILITFNASTHTAQPAAPSPGLEDPSIKPRDPATTGMHIGVAPGGVFNATNVTLKTLIQQAYDIRDFQVSGGPGWLDTQRYDIVAKGNGSGPSEAEMRTMTDEQRKSFEQQLLAKLRTLLADRFQLKVHRETKELPVYVLGLAKNGPKFQAATDGDITRSGLNQRRGEGGKSDVTVTRMPLSNLVKFLSGQVGRTVLDQTGLKGNYDLKFSFAPDLAPGDTDGPSIFTAIQDQLGLKLEAQKGPVEVMVIDSVEKASEN